MNSGDEFYDDDTTSGTTGDPEVDFDIQFTKEMASLLGISYDRAAVLTVQAKRWTGR